jgi:SAM-dependent methyltransferase
MKLPPDAFRRLDESPDPEFYREPRLVTHIDDGAIAAVTQLYREWLPAGGAILDLMSSWISHLPPEVSYRYVAGLGLNAEELAANRRLESFVVHDLNAQPKLPFADSMFDAVCICVSIDYLTNPVSVIRDVGRVVVPNGPLVITFSNRCFPTKAIAIWNHLSGSGQQQLVAYYFAEAGNWDCVVPVTPIPEHGPGDPLFAVIGRRRVTPDFS